MRLWRTGRVGVEGGPCNLADDGGVGKSAMCSTRPVLTSLSWCFAGTIGTRPGLRRGEPGLAAARRTARFTLQLAEEALSVKSTRGCCKAGHNRQGKKCCNKDDPHDYLL